MTVTTAGGAMFSACTLGSTVYVTYTINSSQQMYFDFSTTAFPASAMGNGPFLKQ